MFGRKKRTNVWSKALNSSGPCIVIKDIEKPGYLVESDYTFIKQNLGKPLRVFEVSWTIQGSMCWFAVHTPNGCITLFPENGCTFEFV